VGSKGKPGDWMIQLSDLAAVWGVSHQGVHKYLKDNGFKPQILNGRAFFPPEMARKAMLSRGIEYNKKIVSFLMLKGGAGKTSSALNVAIRANMYGARVLLIDLDQQGNLSLAMGIQDESMPVWVHIIEGKTSIKKAIKLLSSSLHIIPSNLSNSVLDRRLLDGKKNLAIAVKQHIDEVRNEYDLIIIDTAPNLSAINTAAASASDIVVLPVYPDKFAFDGLKKTLADLKHTKKEFQVGFSEKVLFNKFDGREIASHELLKLCFANYSELMLKGFIRTCSEIKNTIQTSKTVFSRKTTAKEDYDIVTRELLELPV